jgi:alpha-N-arabinofuranosidase
VTSVYSNQTNSLMINVVNRHKDEDISTEIINSSGTFLANASVSEINSDDIHAVYTFNKQEQYIPAVKELAVKGNKFIYSFPAHSFTQIILKIREN